MPNQAAAEILQRASISDNVRADAYDAVSQATDRTDLARRLRALPLTDDVRADLWDTRFGKTPSTAAPDAPPRSLVDRAVGALPMIGGTAGGIIGGAGGTAFGLGFGGIPGAVGGAALGGAAGESARQLLTRARGGEAPTTAGGAAMEIGKEAAIQGALEGAGAGVLRAARAGLKRIAVPLARSGLKPNVSAMRRVAGAAMSGTNAEANKIATFLVDEGLTTPAQAQAIVEASERELQSLLQVKNPVTDAPKRVMRYLRALKASAKQQGLGEADAGQIQASMREFLRSEAGQFVNAAGRGARTTRTDMTAREALEMARAQGRWSNRKAYGELKGAAQEASKAVERGMRDALKTAVPAAKPVLTRQGKAIRSRQLLDAMAMRQGNRDILSLPGVVGAAPALAQGRVPILGFATQWLRDNEFKAGVWAGRLARAIERRDVATVTSIMTRLGALPFASQSASPAPERAAP